MFRTDFVFAALAACCPSALGQDNPPSVKAGDKVISIASTKLLSGSRVVAELGRGTIAEVRDLDKSGTMMLVRASRPKEPAVGWVSVDEWKLLWGVHDQAKLDSLLRERVDVLRKRLALLETYFRDADGDQVSWLLDLMHEAMRDLVSAELEIYREPADRIKSREALLERARKHERTIQAWHDTERRGGEEDKVMGVKAKRIRSRA